MHTLQIEVESYDTMADIKRKIQDAKDIPIDKMTLKKYGKDLDDTSTLADHGLEEHDQIECILDYIYMLETGMASLA